MVTNLCWLDNIKCAATVLYWDKARLQLHPHWPRFKRCSICISNNNYYVICFLLHSIYNWPCCQYKRDEKAINFFKVNVYIYLNSSSVVYFCSINRCIFWAIFKWRYVDIFYWHDKFIHHMLSVSKLAYKIQILIIYQ